MKLHHLLEIVHARVIENRRVGPGLSLIRVRLLEPLVEEPKPFQFMMVWVPGCEEIPLSVADYHGDTLVFAVLARGETTRRLVEAREGFMLGVRGPMGRGLEPEPGRAYTLVAGGVGAAPMLYFMKLARSVGATVTYIVGAKTSSLLLYVDEAIRMGFRVLVATDDGSMGLRGTVIDLALRVYDEALRDSTVIICGPKAMIDEATRRLPRGVRGYVVLEEIVKCGVGFCGSCHIGGGLLLCRDGPLIPIEVYRRITGVEVK